jgi:hypothetical protein
MLPFIFELWKHLGKKAKILQKEHTGLSAMTKTLVNAKTTIKVPKRIP